MTSEVTLDDVAEKSGVSRATASRALNGRDGVRDDVRERVHIIAKALGYRPNRAAKNLAGGRTSVIGLLIGRDDIHTDVYAVSLIQAVAKAAEDHDEGLMLLLDSKEPTEAVQNLISDGLVDGVIVSVVALGERWVEELLDAHIPTVLVGSLPPRPGVAVVSVENIESSATVVGHMLDGGCRRLGSITGPLDKTDAMQRADGYRLAHARRSLPVDESLIIAGDYTRQAAYDLADRLIDMKPDGIFCGNDETALGVLRRTTERGIKVPEDLAIAGFDGTSANEVAAPRLTTIHQPFAEVADKAVKALITSITGSDGPLEQLVVPTIFYGETTKTVEGPDA